jgi:hypothetical protein
MAKEPGVSATSHIIATSQTNAHYYIKFKRGKQEIYAAIVQIKSFQLLGAAGSLSFA